MSRRRALAASAALLAGALIVLSLASCEGDTKEVAVARPAASNVGDRPQRPVLYVDARSRAGECSDARPVEAVSISAPWCSLDRALSSAPEGGLVLVRSGEYPAASVSRRARSELLTFRPFDGEHVTLRGVEVEESSHLRFEGFRVRGRTRITFGSHIQLVGNDISPEGITVRPSDHLLIEGNRIHDLTYEGMVAGAGYGVQLSGGWSDQTRPQWITDVTIRGNHFSWVPADAIQAGTVDNLVIEGNEFDHVTPFLDPTEHSDGIQLYGTAKNVAVRRNFFHDQPRALIAKGYDYPGLVIENNLMARLAGIALNIYDAPGVRIVNNTIWDTTTAIRFRDLPEVAAEMKDAVVVNNILNEAWFSPSQLAVEDYNLIGTPLDGVTYGPHDRFVAPRFADPANLDYSLLPDSPAIDAADGGYAPATDRLGRARVDAVTTPDSGAGLPAFADLGAHEFGASAGDGGTTTPPPPGDTTTTPPPPDGGTTTPPPPDDTTTPEPGSGKRPKKPRPVRSASGADLSTESTTSPLDLAVRATGDTLRRATIRFRVPRRDIVELRIRARLGSSTVARSTRRLRGGRARSVRVPFARRAVQRINRALERRGSARVTLTVVAIRRNGRATTMRQVVLFRRG